MKLLLAVIDELYSFAVESLFFRSKQKGETQFLPTLPPETSVSLDEEIEPPLEVPEIHAVGEFFDVDRKEVEYGGGNTIMYIGGGDTLVFLRPTREFDSVIARLPYGEMVMALKEQGRWIQIVAGTIEGWVRRDDLLDRAAYAYPHFVVGERNDVSDTNTVRVRAMLEDEFSGEAAELPLQAAEYVTYRLLRKGLSMEWSDTRPRTPGLWHKLLKGTLGIHVGVTPKTGAIMEYNSDDDEGHLAYVEAVFPDETINISEVGYPENGIYNERVLTREDWVVLRPVFIQVT